MSQEELLHSRNQTIKDYGLLIEYKHLKHHVPSGVYVVPSFDDPRVWYGCIFIRRGYYKDGIFKFSIQIPQNFNAIGTYPKVVFISRIYHPYINEKSNELDLKPKFPEWNPELHFMVSVLSYMKNIFYMKSFDHGDQNVANIQALQKFNDDRLTFMKMVKESVDQSIIDMYKNDQNSTIRFSKPVAAHQELKKRLLHKETSE